MVGGLSLNSTYVQGAESSSGGWIRARTRIGLAKWLAAASTTEGSRYGASVLGRDAECDETDPKTHEGAHTQSG